jgi:LmbE family N-acetylglucosaminyl deacetylase
MHFHNATADVYVPDNTPLPEALRRTTHLGIGAHPDDLEIMALHGILECYGRPDRGFTGVTCTNGAGSPRAGLYAAYTDEQMQQVRRREQRLAASLGGYAAMLQLDYSSAAVKDPKRADLVEDLAAVLALVRPQVVYTHNLADKHDTHIAVAVAAVTALRRLPPADRPPRVHGCEVWRDLDWLPDEHKVRLDVSGRENLAGALTGLYDSQIAGGKRYDLAAFGRQRANATYFESHGVDTATALWFAMDLTPLVRDETLDLAEYVGHFVRRFEADVRRRIAARLPVRP